MGLFFQFFQLEVEGTMSFGRFMEEVVECSGKDANSINDNEWVRLATFFWDNRE